MKVWRWVRSVLPDFVGCSYYTLALVAAFRAETGNIDEFLKTHKSILIDHHIKMISVITE